MPASDHSSRRQAASRRMAAQRRRNHLILLCVFLGIILAALICCLVVLSTGSPVVASLTLETGSALTAEQFLTDPAKGGQFASDVSSINCGKPGTHTVQISVGGKIYESTLILRDTTAPTADPVPTVIAGTLPDAMTLVTNIQDLSVVTATYQFAPDPTVAGDAVAKVLLTDESGNTAVIQVPVTVKTDLIAPVIEIVPFVDHSVYLGDTIAYKSFVTFSDDKTPTDKLKLNVDRSKVDTAKAGTYDVVYTVTDEAGNSTSVTVRLTIKAKPTGSSDKNRRWAAGAVDGFTRGTGDCYTYYATAKALFDVAGIPNVDVVKVKTPQTSQSSHYWSLIDVGNGWYHVDCTPRANNYADSFFLYTDEEMLKYSRNNKNCFNFDPAAYPARQTASVQSHIQFSSSSLKVTIKESW